MDKKTEVVITVNSQQPVAAVMAIQKELDRVKKTYEDLVAAGKGNSEKAKQAAKDIKDLTVSLKEGKESLTRVVSVTNDLANSSMSQLKRALKQVEKEMNRVSENSEKWEELRLKHKAINDQMNVLKGSMLNIGKGMKDLGAQTDAWLQRAIQQQQELVNNTRQGTQEYERQMGVLTQLRAEQASRAVVTINSGTASANALRDARSTLTSYRDSIGSGGIQLGNSKQEISNVNALLKESERQLDAIAGKAGEVELTLGEVEMAADDIIIDPKRFTPKEIQTALDNIKKKLNDIQVGNPLRDGLQQSAKRLQEILNGVGKEVVDVDAVMRNLKTAPLEQLQLAAKKLEKEMAQLNRDEAEYAEKQKQFEMVRQEIDRATGSVKQHGTAWTTTLKNVASYFSAFQLFSKGMEKMKQLVQLNLSFSDQLADIRKVSGLTIQEINAMAYKLGELDTRTTIEELNQIAYAGAKLGIGKYGIEGLSGFVSAANQINVALKEDLGDEALTALSKITETMGLIPKMGVEKSMLAVGSAMFQLSATSTSTSANIVEFAKRLTGIARSAGLTTDQLLALGSAADSMYLMPEVASTAFNKLITSLQTNHNLIEKELDISPGTISKLYEAGKSMDAMVLIFDRMKAKGNMNALQSVFKDLGSDGSRLVNVMVTMAKNVDMLKYHLYTSSEAFEEAIAVTKEYEIQQETAMALVERASNLWEKAFVNPNGVDMVRWMAQEWYNVSKSLSESRFFMAEVVSVMGMLFMIVSKLIYLLPTLIQYMVFTGAATALMEIQKMLTGVVAWYRTLRGAITATEAAQRGLNASMKANIFGIVAAAVSTVVFWLLELKKKTEDAEESQKSLNEYLTEAEKHYDAEKRKLDSYVKALGDANHSQEQRERIIKRFNNEYRTYLSKLKLEVTSLDTLRGAYEKLNGEIKKKMFYQMREQAYNDRLGEASKKMADAGIDYTRYVNSPQGAMWKGYGLKEVQSRVDSGMDAEQTYRSMVESRYGTEKGVWSSTGEYITNNGGVGSKSTVERGYFQLYIQKYVEAYQAYMEAKKEIDDTFNGLIGDYSPFEEEDLGSLTNLKPDKEAEKQKKREEAERKKAARQDLNEEKEKARAIIDNVKNYYERQITEVLKLEIDTANQKQITDGLEKRMNEALANVRMAIGGAENDLENFRKTMRDDLWEPLNSGGTNESIRLLDNIINNDVSQLKEMIATLSRELGQNGSSLIDQILRKATENQLANAKAENTALKERIKYLLERNHTGKVDREYESQMEQMEVAPVSEKQKAKLQAMSKNDDGKAVEEFFKNRSRLWQQAFMNARENLVKLLATLPDGEASQDLLMRLLFGDGYAATLGGSELETILDMDLEQWQVFYQKLLEYSDAYTEAQKKAREQQKKVIDEQWKATDRYKENQDAQDYQQLLSSGVSQFSPKVQQDKEQGKDVPRKDAYGTTAFVSSFGTDPEVEGYRLKMEAASAYYEFLKQRRAEEATMREAEQSLLQAEMDYARSMSDSIRQQVADIFELTSPVEDFGTSVGEAFATMTEDAEAGRMALKSAVADMMKAFMKQTVEMTKEYLKRRIMQKMNDKLMSVSMKKVSKEQVGIEQKKEKSLLDTQELGGKAKEMLTEEVGKKTQEATRKIGQETLSTQLTQTQQEVQTESAATQAKTSMGIASGASKIIGSLGWWGIPLVAVIQALLNGLLSMAMSKVSSLFGGGASKTESDAEAPSVKLAPGMLTYDAGNVQAFRGVEDGKTYPVVGNDGKVYAARDAGKLETGLVKDPITALVNGQPALVAERGPEMVIGRETTAAMMMARPDLLAEIVKFDRLRSGMTYRAYDAGNVAEFKSAEAQETGSGLMKEDVDALREAIAGFSDVMTRIQQKGLHVNKYGRGGIVEAAESGRKFMKRFSGDRLWKP